MLNQGDINNIMRERESEYLSFIEHWNLHKNNREIGIAKLQVFTYGLPIVTLVWFFPKELDKDNDNPHVEPLHEKHERHGQTHVHTNS